MTFERLFDILPYQATRYPKSNAISAWGGAAYSTLESVEIINSLSAGFIKKGIQVGQNVLIWAHCGSPEWNFVDFALQQIGAVVVPIHANISNAQLEYILEETNANLVVCSNKILCDRIKNIKNRVIPNIISFQKIDEVVFWKDLEEKSNDFLEELAHRKNNISEHHLATIIYTSGTTGEPKGVMLSHRNIVSNIKAVIALIPVGSQHTTISFLPLSHVFERMVTYSYMVVGATICYISDNSEISVAIKKIRPHYFTAVPRFLEKIYDALLEKIAKQPKFLRKISYWVLALGEKYEGQRGKSWWYRCQLWAANVVVFGRWRAALGGNVKGVIVGAAALQPRLGRLFSAAKIRIREGYGLTETSPVVAFNRFEPGGTRFGTVGIPITGVELKIDAPDEQGVGEIWVRSPGVMLGYYKKAAETAAVIDAENWFKTGDVGKIVFKRFLQLTDRKKDIFKTSSGRYVAPQMVENLLKASPFVEQCLVVGANKSYVAALVVPSFVRLQEWCEANKVHWTAPQFMVINPKVVKYMDSQLAEVNAGLKSYEQIKKIHLLYEEWTAESGELTPTLKPRRSVIVEKYAKDIAEMYDY